jgi:hypothetical protein
LRRKIGMTLTPRIGGVLCQARLLANMLPCRLVRATTLAFSFALSRATRRSTRRRIRCNGNPAFTLPTVVMIITRNDRNLD